MDRSEQWDRFLSIHSRTAGEELVVSASLDEAGEREQGGGAGTSGKASNGVPTWGELHNNLGAIEKVVKRRRKAVDVYEKTEVTSTNSQDETAEKVLHTDKRDVQDPYPWEEELEFLVRGGAPMALRGEVRSSFSFFCDYAGWRKYSFQFTFRFCLLIEQLMQINVSR